MTPLTQITYTALPTIQVRAYQQGGQDAYGQAAERQASDGNGNPCRHCLQLMPKGAGMLVLAHRPFKTLHSYAEVGPIFLCADPCTGYGTQTTQPPALRSSPDYLLKGYGDDDRIIYGTGAIIAVDRVAAHAAEVFADPKVAYIHIRSARNNCYQARIDRA